VLLSLLLASMVLLTSSFLMPLGRMAAIVLAAFVGLLPLWMICFKRKRRMEKFQRQLPDAMELIARALKAGHAFTVGLRMVADELGDPIGPEFEKTLHEINFGLGVPEALKNLPDRVDCPDLRFFIISVILQRETGGNLAEILEKNAHLIRERFKLQGHIRALSAEGKLSAMILVALPFVIALVLSVLNPKYVRTLFVDPLGRILIALSLVLMVIGVVVMKRMIAIRV
jgi:tight adherence protein B